MILLVALGLAGCGTDGVTPGIMVEDHFMGITVDSTLRTCKQRPPRPNLLSQKGVAQAMLDLDDRGEDCASKLRNVWQTIDDFNKRIDDLNKQSKPHVQPTTEVPPTS